MRLFTVQVSAHVLFLPAGLMLTWGLLDLFHTPLGLWKGLGWGQGAYSLFHQKISSVSPNQSGWESPLRPQTQEALPVKRHSHTHVDKTRVKLLYLSCWFFLQAVILWWWSKPRQSVPLISLLWTVSFNLSSSRPLSLCPSISLLLLFFLYISI